MRLRRTHTHTRTHTDTGTGTQTHICTNTLAHSKQQNACKKFDKTAENIVFLTFAPLTFAIKHFSLIYQQGCGIFFLHASFFFHVGSASASAAAVAVAAVTACLPAGIVCFAMFRLALHTRCVLHIYTCNAFRLKCERNLISYIGFGLSI